MQDQTSTFDLRLKRRREAADTIAIRAAALNAEDRGLLEAVYARGLTVQEVARMLGHTRPSQVRQLRRRVKKLVTRVSDPRFVFVMSCSRQWPSIRRRIAERCVLRGDSMRGVARDLGVSLHTVRKHCQQIEGMFEAAAIAAAHQRRGSAA